MRALILVACLLLVVAAFIPLASAHDDGLHVIMTGSDKEYDSGETAEVQVHVFHDGERVDPDEDPNIKFLTDESGEGGETRDMSVTKTATGHYTGTINIFDSDLEGSTVAMADIPEEYETADENDYAMSYGKLNDTDTTYDYVTEHEIDGVPIYMKWKEGFDLTYSISNLDQYPWEPGEKVIFTIKVWDEGQLFAPKEFKLQEASWDPEDNTDVPWDNPSDGVYEAEFQIPSDLKKAEDYEIVATAKEGDRTSMISFDIPVDMFHVWYNELSTSTKSQRDFDLYVADMTGEPVSGVEVGISYYQTTMPTRAYIQKVETTDSAGKASFSVTDMEGNLGVSGWATKDDKNQTFSGYLYYGDVSDSTEDNLDPWPYGFDVETDNDEFTVASGKVNHEFVAFYDDERMYNADIFYYAYTPFELLGFGEIKTNQKGEFTVEVTAPADDDLNIKFDFETVVGDHPDVFEGYDWEDTDKDGYSDAFEKFVGSDHEDGEDVPCSYKDSDGDEYGDKYEEYVGTDPNDSSDFPSDYNDTDGDGFGDEFEEQEGTNPEWFWDSPSMANDTDDDDHSDQEEEFYGTDPNDPDDYPYNSYANNTDGDSVGYWYWDEDDQFDLEEIFYGTDPNDEEDYPEDIYDEDTDYDGVHDEEEKWYGTDPEDYSSAPDREPDPWDERWDDHNSTNGKLYESDSEYLSPIVEDFMDYISHDKVRIEVDNFKVGGTTKVTLKDVPQSSTTIMSLSYVGGVDVLEDHVDSSYNYEWESWSNNNFLYLYPDGDNYVGMTLTPSFLPAGEQKYTFIGAYTEAGETYINHVEVKDGQSKSAGKGGSSGSDGDGDLGGLEDAFPFLAGAGAGVIILLLILVIVVVVILIVVVIAVILAVVMKGKKKKAAADDPGPPKDEPARSSFAPPPPPDDPPPPPSD